MKVLGIDPGTTRIGYGLVEKNKSLNLLDYGLISGQGMSSGERLIHLEKELGAVIKRTRPDLVCVEKLFFTKNKKTALSVSEARGVIMLTVGRMGIEAMELTPNEIKSIVVGDGGATKDQVQKVACVTLGVDSISGPDDVSDAVAIALAGLFQKSFGTS
ncbi:MAG: crossover junction endodeoxyribonuclease RuvC [Candidatus Colwellbacteria bacterium CG10_big_fil_rev_8_21_14_0_10_42_22]|uniref:Crossover junction endodeoxyribonuclease RuvC n=1 Tax=Candidatus Colwellbacteria bacterium CG10_big_fil_rev_8_21_14_0_10_42_22 TaxID=1974540 RepID=A0A2H0VFT3_9BACT|nr:MAG: crossover junction endodeoxyribonuclease RuvC [Candidatus Colwellbacteria bacterium CG10_big_fil_rev_8_21_14_0_10_42_22]